MKIIITLSHMRKAGSFLIHIFLSTITFQFSFHFFFISLYRLMVSSSFNSVLFAQEIPKELTLLCMDYDKELRLENVESQK